MILLQNKKARVEYEFLSEFQAGVQLTGPEVKSLRMKSGSLHGSFVKILRGEIFLVGAQITPYKFADNREYDPLRTRKLLLHKSEVSKLVEASQTKGRTLVPISFELTHNKIKLNFAVARGKKVHERRAELKKRAVERDIERDIKQKIRL